MDGGRGGGRGKGKKAKAAKKKAAAAAAQAALAAQAAHKQKPHHSGKKVGASHASVQVVAVSKASPTSSNTQAEATAGGPHEQTMTKSKRKRLKKAAAGALLKKQAETDKQHKKSPTAAAAASAVSPKTKNVAVLTPLPLPPAAAVVKPHVVSLTGGKKKKRKRNAGVEESAVAAAEEGASEEKEKEKPKEAKKEKTVVLVGKAKATSPSVAAKGKSLTPTTTSPKRKIAQLGSVAQKTKEPHVSKEGGVALTTASPKSGVTVVKKVKAKTETVKADPAATKGEVSVKKLDKKNPATTEGETKVTATKLEAKKTVQPEQKPAVVVTSTASTAMRTEAVEQKPTIVQAVEQSPVMQQQVSEDGGRGNNNCDLSAKTPSESEVMTTPNKATKRAIIQTAASIASTIATEDKPAVSKPAPSSVSSSKASLEPAKGEPTDPVPISARTVVQRKSEPHESAPTPAIGAVHEYPAKPSDEAIAAAPTTQETAKAALPKAAATATATGPAPVPSSGLKRRRSTDQDSGNAFAQQPPAKRSAVGTSQAAVAQSAVTRKTDSRDARSPICAPSSSSDQVSTLPTELAVPASRKERPADTPVAFKDAPKELRLTPLASTTVPASQNMEQNPANKTALACSTGTVATSQPKPILKPEAMPSTTVQTETETDRLPSTTNSADTIQRSRKVEIVLDSHSYVQKMMRDELKASIGDCRRGQAAELTVALPPRPRNAWGASFGMAPPSNAASSAPRTLSTTPLSSWFLSKGCANFIKQVHFSDDDDGSSDDDSDDISTPELHSGTPRGIDKASPKRRTSVVKKNAFLESLKTQSNWRSWYGNVDMHDLLDPPLAHVPDKLQTHNVTPLELPEATEIRAVDKRASELEMLEHDIRREKQRGSAFSEQLLMMLQGKTVSGKPLEEEYKPILQ